MNKKNGWKIGLLFLIPFILAGIMQFQSKDLREGIYLDRNKAGEGDKELVLQLKAEGLPEEYEYKVHVEEMLYTEEEANALMEGAIREIEKDFEEITDVIPSKKTYQNKAVEATWRFDHGECMDFEGNIIKSQIPEEGLVVNAQVGLKCQNYENVHNFSFLIPRQPFSQAELLLSAVSDYIQAEMQKEGQSRITLPSQIDGVTLVWKEPKDYLVIKILFLEILVAVLLFVSKIEKRKQEEKKKQESMEMDYPKIVGQMTILLGAGMTIPQAWNKISLQYCHKKESGVIDQRPAYEEMVYINRRMQEGESEREALSVMEKRVLLMPYRRMIRILLNNKSKGGDNLCGELEKEATLAYAQRVYDIKQKGEEASTKMLAPLMLMMILVIAIVILPACIGFAG